MFLERFLLSNLWNAGLICVILVLKRIMQNRTSLRFHYYSWYVLIASLLLFFMPSGVWSEWLNISSERQQTIATYNISANTATTTTNDGVQWLQDTTQLITEDTGSVQLEFIILAIWLIGVLTLVGFYWCGGYRLRQIRQFAMYPSKEIQDLFEACCQRLGLKKNVQVRQSRLITAPVSFGWKKPFVVLPSRGISKLSETELEHIVLHELSHIRHGDLITNYLFCGLQAIYWFNPLVWLAFRQMRRDREAYCDWAVLNELDGETARLGYGQTILNFAGGCKTHFHTANGLCQSKEQLKYRMEQIVSFHQETKWRKISGRWLTGILALLCAFQIPVLAVYTENADEYYTPADTLSISEAEWDTIFADTNGCAVVYDLNADHYTVYNAREITRRVPPCSTFKIYSALNALELGMISPTDNTLSWDGTQREVASWEQNHNLTSAMQQSVNWYFQTLDQNAGAVQLAEFYKSIEYGNGQIGMDARNYWNGSSLKISALEQVELLGKPYRNDFGFNNENVAAVKDALYISSSENSALYGKTGTGKIDSTNVAGWFIGYVEQADNTYFLAVYLCSDEGTDGGKATQVASDILISLGVEVNIPA